MARQAENIPHFEVKCVEDIRQKNSYFVAWNLTEVEMNSIDAEKPKITTVDEYIIQFPLEVQEILRKLRILIKETAPEAAEKIGYGMPGYYLNGPLVYFGAHAKHIGLYPGGGGIPELEAELAGYKQSKGAVQFPLDKPIPYDLIRRIVALRREQNLLKKK